MTLSETRERLGKERAEDAIEGGGLGQASDHTLGDNNIGVMGRIGSSSMRGPPR